MEMQTDRMRPRCCNTRMHVPRTGPSNRPPNLLFSQFLLDETRTMLKSVIQDLVKAQKSQQSETTLNARKEEAQLVCEILRKIVRQADRNPWRRAYDQETISMLYDDVLEFSTEGGSSTAPLLSGMLVEDILMRSDYASLWPVCSHCL